MLLPHEREHKAFRRLFDEVRPVLLFSSVLCEIASRVVRIHAIVVHCATVFSILAIDSYKL